jgi:glutamate/tyrosine decarboxylase-like PLP-dependent enzyme
MGAGMFFCRHPGAVDEAFHAETSYMPKPAGVSTRDPYTSSTQWSRRFIGLKLFMALAELGESGYAAMIEHQAAIGDALRTALVGQGWQVVNNTPLPLVCFTKRGLDTFRFLTALYERQIAWFSEVRLAGGSPVLRACITSFKTTEDDINDIVHRIGQLD